MLLPMTATRATQKDTKTAIMDAAEILMAEHGINGISNRAILAKAGANTAALHYHFNSREGLIEAMIARRGLFTSVRRVELIAEFDRSGRAPTPMDIVNIVVDPMIELLQKKGDAGRRFLRFIARLQSDRAGIHHLEERKHFPEIRERLFDMIRQACPEVPESELQQRATMLTDAVLQSVANAECMTTEWTNGDQHTELMRFVANLKTFLAGGLAAPAT